VTNSGGNCTLSHKKQGNRTNSKQSITDQTQKYQDKYLTETMNLFINIEIINKPTTQQLKAVISETKHSQSQTYPNTITNQYNERQPYKQILNQVHKQN
jgi:hypothetical protein